MSVSVEISGKLEVLELEPEDRIVISCDQRLSLDTADAIKSKVSGATGVPEERVLILGGGMSLHVLRNEPSSSEEPEVRCSACGRRSLDLELHGLPCRMPQPNGERCNGRMVEA